MKMRKLFKKGFTLVELVVVIAVIAVLAAVSVGAYFGVTDSANSSNATAGAKQVKDLWTMYYVSEYSNEKSLDYNAADFCLRYVEENGPEYDVNYIVLPGQTETQSLAGNSYSGSVILFKIETQYPSLFVVKDGRIMEEFIALKSDDEMKTKLDSTAIIDIHNSEFTAFVENGMNFEIETIGPIDGITVRGFRKYQITVSDLPGEVGSKNFYIDPFTSLQQCAPEQFTPSDIYVDDVKVGPNFRLFYDDGTELYGDTIIEGSDIIIEKIDDPSYMYSYTVDKKEIKYQEAQNNYDFDTYPIAIVSSSSKKNGWTYSLNHDIVYVSNENYIDDSLLNNSDWTSIFIKEATIRGNINLSENKVMVVSHNISPENITSYVGNYFEINNRGIISNNLYENIDKIDYLQIKNNNSTVKEPFTDSSDVVSKLTIEGEIHLSNSSYLLVDGIVKTPTGGSGMLQIEKRGEVINNGKIYIHANESGNVDSSSSGLRCVSKIAGTGEIIAEKGSIILEPIKFYDFYGGTNASASISANPKVFPYIDYIFDGIQCDLVLTNGANYYGFSGMKVSIIDTTSERVGLITNNRNSSLFAYNQNQECKIIKSFKNNKNYIIIEKGEILDGSLVVKFIPSWLGLIGSAIGINPNINSILMNFPLANLNVKICDGASLTLSNKQNNNVARYEILPTSSIEIEAGGALNIGNGVSLSFVDPKVFNDIMTETRLDENGMPTSERKYNNPANPRQLELYQEFMNMDQNLPMIKNEGTINVGSSSGDIGYIFSNNTSETIDSENNIVYYSINNIVGNGNFNVYCSSDDVYKFVYLYLKTAPDTYESMSYGIRPFSSSRAL